MDTEASRTRRRSSSEAIEQPLVCAAPSIERVGSSDSGLRPRAGPLLAFPPTGTAGGKART